MDRTKLLSKFKKKMGKNFITPDVLGYKTKGKTVIELSTGSDMNHIPMFGVTVRQLVLDDWENPELSKVFYSKREAEAHMEKVKEVV